MLDNNTDMNLSQAAATTRAALSKKARAIIENAKLIDGCEGPHEFEPEGDKGNGAPVRFRCKKCQGIAAPNEVLWYRHGMEHGARPQTQQEVPDHGRTP